MAIILDETKKIGSITLSADKLTATCTGYGFILASEGKSSGKWYWETYLNKVTSSSQNSLDMGIANINAISDPGYSGYYFVGCSTNSIGYTCNGIYYDGTVKFNPGTSTTGDTIGFALDIDNKILKIYKNGSLLTTVSLTTYPVSTPIYPAVGGSYSGANDIITINFGANHFKYQIPEGFTSYDGNKTSADNWTIYRNSLDNMQIGDKISCEYVAQSGKIGYFANLGNATKAEIPVASSATPNGKFYFIHTGYDMQGRMKLVADRNIQHSISWDTINAAGLIFGTNSSLGVANPSSSSASYYLNSTYYAPSKAFDGSYVSGTYGWHAHYTMPAEGEWIQAHYDNPIKIKRIDIYPGNPGSDTSGIKHIKILGSNDNVTFTKVPITKWVYGASPYNTDEAEITFKYDEWKTLEIDDSIAYKYWRIHLIDLYDGYYPAIAEIRLYTDAIPAIENANLIMRSLTGGTNSSDKDNEWDKIICESNLNNTIIPGNNTIWNWNGLYSWTSSYPVSASSRVARGSSAANGYSESNASSAVATTVGFRPVLLAELNVKRGPKAPSNLQGTLIR